MKGRHIETVVLVCTTLLSGAAAIWNAIDEVDILQTWMNVAIVAGAWSLVPLLTAFAGLRSRDPVMRRVHCVLSVLYAVVLLRYALNGSTSGRGQGAQHMHLVLVPVLQVFVSAALWAPVLLLRGADALRQRRKPDSRRP